KARAAGGARRPRHRHPRPLGRRGGRSAGLAADDGGGPVARRGQFHLAVAAAAGGTARRRSRRRAAGGGVTPMTLTRRVFLAVLLGFLLLAGGLSIMGWMREQVLSRQTDALLLTWYEHAWREAVDRHDLQLRVRVAPFLAAETALGPAIAERRFPELRAELAQLFGRLAANVDATALQLVDVQSRILYTTSLA